MAAARSITILISMKNQEKRSKEGLVLRIRLVDEWNIDEYFNQGSRNLFLSDTAVPER